MRILSLDIATTTGYAVMVDGVVEESGSFLIRDMNEYHIKILELIDLWKPEHVIAAKPSRFFNTIFLHGKYFGAAEVALGKRNLSFYMDTSKKGKPTLPMDSHMKKFIFGKGVVSKQEIMDWACVQQEDEADAIMFAAYLNKTLNG